MEPPSTFPAIVVREQDGTPAAGVEWLSASDLPEGEVLIEVEASSLNYKDALACQGHRGVVAKLPHVPGIDCAGRVAACDGNEFAVGDGVLVTGYDLGSGAWGGYAKHVRAPASWVVPLPTGLSPTAAMTYGTAGFTAAQAVSAIVHQGVEPDDGPLLVTGATGGVGLFSLAILAKLGFEVVAMTGKPSMHEALNKLGAARFVDRDLFADAGDRPLLKGEWAGAVDTVGGETLSALLRSTRHRGCVAACGLVGGDSLPLTVHPFILRGVTLAGIDSAKCPRDPRLEMWGKLSGDWRVELPEAMVTSVTLDELPQRAEAMLAGQTSGRTLVKPTTTRHPPE